METLKILQAISLFDAIEEIKSSKPKLDFSVWMNLGKIHSELKTVYESYGIKQSELIDEYAEKDEKGKYIMLSEGVIKLANPEKYKEEIKTLNETTIEVQITKISRTEFEGVKMEGSDNLFSLFEFVIE